MFKQSPAFGWCLWRGPQRMLGEIGKLSARLDGAIILRTLVSLSIKSDGGLDVPHDNYRTLHLPSAVYNAYPGPPRRIDGRHLRFGRD